jgi:hypothetical protein
VNIDKDKWLQPDSARIATGTDQFPLDEEALRAHGGGHIAPTNQNDCSREGERER